MKNTLFLFIVLIFAQTIFGQDKTKSSCIDSAPVIQPQISDETRRDMETRLAEAKARFDKNLQDADAIIWLGRRTAYLGKYKEAIEIYTKGISIHPNDARLYRHRGHRFITLRCFNDAVKDFETAVKLIKDKPDEIEPDGQPNAKNIPTSTLQSNIWYHLGLSFYLKGDFNKALKAYRECVKVSKNPDMLVATTHWLYMTLRRLDKPDEAKKVLEPITDNMEIIENEAYYKLLLMYQGKLKPIRILEEAQQGESSLNNASIGYGVGNWFLYYSQREKAFEIFRQITSGNQWASFGFIAAETELKK